MTGIVEAWTVFRGAANVREIRSLLRALPSLPISIDLRPESLTQPIRRQTILVPWVSGAELPSDGEQFPNERPNALVLFPAPDPHAVQAMEDFGNTIKTILPNPKLVGGIDLARVPASQWMELLGRWVKKA